MRVYATEPPWRGFNRWYGEWRWVPPDSRLWIEEPGYWQWLSPERPGSFMGQFANVLEGYKYDLSRELKRALYGDLIIKGRT